MRECSDTQYFRAARESLGLDRALITNGFHTIEITGADFSRFVGPAGC